MKLFVKADHYTVYFVLLMTLIADIALIVSGIQDNTFNTSFIIACVLTILVTVLWLICRKEGLYIQNDTLCYKGIRKKYYKVNQIAELHIVKDQIYIGDFISVDVKSKGENKYRIIYLKNRDFAYCSNDDGMCDFYLHHGKHILFTTVYDAQAVEYFQSKKIPVTGEIQ